MGRKKQKAFEIKVTIGSVTGTCFVKAGSIGDVFYPKEGDVCHFLEHDICDGFGYHGSLKRTTTSFIDIPAFRTKEVASAYAHAFQVILELRACEGVVEADDGSWQYTVRSLSSC